MNIYEQKKRHEHFHDLIKREATGDRNAFAKKLNLKKTQIYEMMNEYKYHGADIKYDRMRKTYYYANDFIVKIDISFEIKKII
jgi:predicted DNA-binding transcriptional regulator YafY